MIHKKFLHPFLAKSLFVLGIALFIFSFSLDIPLSYAIGDDDFDDGSYSPSIYEPYDPFEEGSYSPSIYDPYDPYDPFEEGSYSPSIYDPYDPYDPYEPIVVEPSCASNEGSSCQACNNVSQCNTGSIQCDGICSATAPADDTTPPTISINATSSFPNNKDTVTFSTLASDSSGIAETKIFIDENNDGNFNDNGKTCASSFCAITTGPYPAGQTISYYATTKDTAGNFASTLPTKSFVVAFACSSATGNSCQECNSTGQCNIGFIQCDGICSASAPTDDTTSPISTINSPGAGSWDNDPSFSVSVSDSDNTGGSGLAICRYHVYDSGVGWTVSWGTRTCNASRAITVGIISDCRSQGKNTCTVYAFAQDGAGNIGPSSIRTFSIDYTDPIVGGVSPTSAEPGIVQTFSVLVSDAQSGVRTCELLADGDEIGSMTLSNFPCTSCIASRSHTFLTSGTHTMFARCVDEVGQIGTGSGAQMSLPEKVAWLDTLSWFIQPVYAALINTAENLYNIGTGPVTEIIVNAIIPPLTFPPDTWQRLWYINPELHNFRSESFISEGPHEVNEKFNTTSNWGGRIIGGLLNFDIGFRSSRSINFPTGGSYTFTITSDDGVRLWIDDDPVPIIDEWHELGEGSGVYTANRNMSARNHDFIIEWYEHTGNAYISFDYQGFSLTLNKSEYEPEEDIVLTAQALGLSKQLDYEIYFTIDNVDASQKGAIPCNISASTTYTCTRTFSENPFLENSHQMCAFLRVSGSNVNSDCVSFSIVSGSSNRPTSRIIAMGAADSGKIGYRTFELEKHAGLKGDNGGWSPTSYWFLVEDDDNDGNDLTSNLAQCFVEVNGIRKNRTCNNLFFSFTVGEFDDCTVTGENECQIRIGAISIEGIESIANRLHAITTIIDEEAFFGKDFNEIWFDVDWESPIIPIP